MQINKATKLAYQGRNQADLLKAKKANNYKSDEWVTFVQARGLGLKIKKGSKAVPIFRGFTEYQEKTEKRKQKKMWFLCYDCFNYDWLPAEKHLVDYYEDLGNDFCYCPYCDRQCPMVMEVGRKPGNLLLKIKTNF